MDIEPIAGVDAILEHAGRLILRDEARHNLALGILSTTRAHPDLYPEIRGWVARSDRVAVGAAFRTPPYNLVLVRPALERALVALAESITTSCPVSSARSPRSTCSRPRGQSDARGASRRASSRGCTRSAG